MKKNLILAITFLLGVMVGIYSTPQPTTLTQLIRPTLTPSSVPNEKPMLVAAGIPRSEDVKDNPLSVFRKFEESNVSFFYPTFQYQEVPEPLALNTGELFLSACDSPTVQHEAMRTAKVKIILPVEVFYGREKLPSLEKDPVADLIRCVGRDLIAGVTNYDEPVHTDVELKQVEAVYERIRQIDPTLPIFMVHAPVLADEEGVMTEQERRFYLEKVKKYSQYADVIGFDVYAIPAELGKMSSPYANGDLLTYDRAIEDYLLWLKEFFPDKEHLIVYQGFAFADQYSEEIKQTLPSELLSLGLTRPTKEQVNKMHDLAFKYGVSYVIWWGQSFGYDNETWQSVLSDGQQRF